MPKIKKNFFYKNLIFNNMHAAYIRARENKSDKTDVMFFGDELEKNIVNLIKEIRNGTYEIGLYREFKVYEPKERVIKSLPFRDRVVHQWYVHEFIIPTLVPKFIYDSYACITTKGTHRAVRRVNYFMRKARAEYGNYYILKMDIKKFFYSIDPKILMTILSKHFGDKLFLQLSERLIFEKGVDKGIPIGNYTSQYFANLYLHELDMYIKHELKVKYYVRYMDDFVLLVENKFVAKKLLSKIEKFLETNLKLKLNPKSRYYPCNIGVDFCGYRIFHTHILVRNRSKKQMRKKIKVWNKLYEEKNLNIEVVRASISSWKGHISHANSFNLEKNYLNKMAFKNLITGKSSFLADKELRKNVLQNLTNDEKVSILHDLMKEDKDIKTKVYLAAMVKYSRVNTNKIASSIYKMLNPLDNDDVIDFTINGGYDFSIEHDASFDMLNYLLDDHFIYLIKFKELKIKDVYQKYLFCILKGIQRYLFESNSESVHIFQDDLNVIGSNLFYEWKEFIDNADEIKRAELTIRGWYGYDF